MTKEINELLDKLAELQKKNSGTVLELKRSLAIQKLWPEAFACGKVSSVVRREPLSTQQYNSYVRRKQPVKGTFTITRSDGEERVFPVSEVPNFLLPEEIRIDEV